MNLKVLPLEIENIILDYYYQLVVAEKKKILLKELEYEHLSIELDSEVHIRVNSKGEYTSYHNVGRPFRQYIFINKYYPDGRSYTMYLDDVMEDEPNEYSLTVDECDYILCEFCFYEDDFDNDVDFDGNCLVCGNEYFFGRIN